jgi:hypothetical protein
MIQPKYSPQEALERVKLMMKYDMGKTLNENKEIVLEQPSPATAGLTAAGAVTGGAIAAGGLGALAASAGLGTAAAGAAAGTAAFPIVGTAVGALIGLGLGVIGNWAANKDNGKEEFAKLISACKSPGASKLVKQMSPSDIRTIVYNIEDAKGDWNDDEDAIVAELRKIQTIADLCEVDKKITGGLFEFLDGLTDSPQEWKMFARPIAGMIEDTQILLTPEEQKKTGGGKTGGGSTYKPCSGTYEYGCKSDVIAQAQKCLGLVTDGKFGPKTQAALATKGFSKFTDADIQKICSSVEPVNQNPYAAYQNADVEDGDVDVTNASGSKTSVVNTPEGE